MAVFITASGPVTGVLDWHKFKPNLIENKVFVFETKVKKIEHLDWLHLSEKVI